MVVTYARRSMQPEIMAVSQAIQVPAEIKKIMESFKEVFDEEILRPMRIDPIRLKMINKPNPSPKKIKTARAYPKHMEKTARRTESGISVTKAT